MERRGERGPIYVILLRWFPLLHSLTYLGIRLLASYSYDGVLGRRLSEINDLLLLYGTRCLLLRNFIEIGAMNTPRHS